MKKIFAALSRIKAVPSVFRHAQDRVMLALLMINLSMVTTAHAQAAPGGLQSSVQGICKLTSFVSEWVVYAVLAGAVTIYGLMYAINAMREGVMENVLRVTMGGGVGLSGIALITYGFGKSVC